MLQNATGHNETNPILMKWVIILAIICIIGFVGWVSYRDYRTACRFVSGPVRDIQKQAGNIGIPSYFFGFYDGCGDSQMVLFTNPLLNNPRHSYTSRHSQHLSDVSDSRK